MTARDFARAVINELADPTHERRNALHVAQRLAEAEAGLAHVKALHQPERGIPDWDTCRECSRVAGSAVPYPCPTRLAVDPEVPR